MAAPVEEARGDEAEPVDRQRPITSAPYNPGLNGGAWERPKYCVRCGRSLDELQQFCGACGDPIEAPSGEVPPAVDRHGSHVASLRHDDDRPTRRRGRGRTAALVVFIALVLVSASGLAFTLLTDGSDRIAATAPATSTSTSTSTTAAITTSTASTTPPPAVPPPGAGSFADVYRQVNDGVVRIDAELCGSSGVGTGFLISRDMAVTAAHAVAGSTALLVTTTGASSEGTVVGIDHDRDLALVQLDRAFRGHNFDFVTDRPDVGAPVALVGYPLGEPLSLATGAVSGLDRTVPTESGPLDGLIQTDVASNPGNSGGPLLNLDPPVR